MTKPATICRSRFRGNRDNGVTRIIVVTIPATANNVRPETSQLIGGTNSRQRSIRGRPTSAIISSGIKYPSSHHGFGSREKNFPSPAPRIANKITPIVSSNGLILIQPVLLDPRLRYRAKAQQPIIELLQTPTPAVNQPLPQALIFQPAQPITHRHRRTCRVPIHVCLRARLCKSQMLLHMPHCLLIAVSSRLQSQIHQDPMTSPERVVQLLHFQPRRTIDFQIHHHLLAPQCPPLVKHRMRKKPPPFARMPIRSHKLEMMSRIRLVRTGQSKTEMLLLLGKLFGLARFRHTQIVHPKNSTLSFLECGWLSICRRRNHHPQKFRNRFHLQLVPFRKRHRAGIFEPPGNPICFIPIKLQQRFRWSPLSSPLCQDLLCTLAPPETYRGFLQQPADPFHFPHRKLLDLPQRIVQPEFILNPPLQCRRSNCKRTRWRKRPLPDLAPISFQRFFSGLDSQPIVSIRPPATKKVLNSIEQYLSTNHTLLHHPQPDSLEPAHCCCSFVQKIRCLFKKRSQIRRRVLRF